MHLVLMSSVQASAGNWKESPAHYHIKKQDFTLDIINQFQSVSLKLRQHTVG